MSNCYALSNDLDIIDSKLYIKSKPFFELNEDARNMISCMEIISENNQKFSIIDLSRKLGLEDNEEVLASLNNVCQYLSKVGVLNEIR